MTKLTLFYSILSKYHKEINMYTHTSAFLALHFLFFTDLMDKVDKSTFAVPWLEIDQQVGHNNYANLSFDMSELPSFLLDLQLLLV